MNNKILTFEKSDKNTIEIIQNAVAQNDFWKAQRLLRSQMQNNPSLQLFQIAIDLHSKMPGYQNIEEDFLPLIFGNDFEALLFGGRCLVAHFLDKNDENKAKKVAEFVRSRLRMANVQFDQKLFEEAIDFKFSKNKFSFVEKDEKSQQFLRAADVALGEGNLELVLSQTSQVDPDGEAGDLAQKIECEVFLRKKDLKNAENSLKNIQKNGQDCYYYALLAQIQFSKKDREFENSVQKLLEFEIENESQFMIAIEALLAVSKTNEVKFLIEKYQKSFEFFAPMYLAKWLVSYAQKDIDSAKENLLKCTLLDKRRVVEKEILLCMEEGVKLPSKISISEAYPAVVVDRAQKRIKGILAATPVALQTIPKYELENALFWIEIFGSPEIAQNFSKQLLMCKVGVDLVKENLLSFQTSDWLKKVFISSLVEAGADNIFVWFLADELPKGVRIMMPDVFLKEIYSDSLAKNGEFFAKFVHSYSCAVAEFCFCSEGFEERLKEVGERLYCEFVNLPKNNKIGDRQLLATLLFCTCNDAIECTNKKVSCSQFSTVENVCGELDILASDLKELLKNIL